MKRPSGRTHITTMINYPITRNPLSILGSPLSQPSYSPTDTHNNNNKRSTTNVIFSKTPLINNYNESTEAPSTPLLITTINNSSNSKSKLQKGDDILAIKIQPCTNNNGLVSDTSRSRYINKPTTPSTSVLVIQTINNEQILYNKLASQLYTNARQSNNTMATTYQSHPPPHHLLIHALIHALVHANKYSKDSVENALQLPRNVSNQTLQDEFYGSMASIVLYCQCQHQHIYLLYFDTWVAASICFVLVCTACISLPLFFCLGGPSP